MGAECVVCGGSTRMLARKCRDGSICNSCYGKTPSFFKASKEEAGVVRFLVRQYEEENEEMTRKFRETCRVGNLHFDTDHLLAVIGGIKGDGTVEEGCSDIFSIANIKDFSFSMVNSEALSDKKVACDILFTCSFLDNFWEISEVVSKREKCFAEEENGQLYFSLPPGVQIAWDEVARRINEARGAIDRAINDELTTEADLAYFKARTLFLLENGYTREELEDSYRRLELGFMDKEGAMEIIKKAKSTLEEYLSE